MKLCVNTVIYGLNGAVAESVVLAERSGIARERAYDVLDSSAVAAPFVGYKRAAFVDPANTPVAFAVELAEKDLRLIKALAESTDTPMPQATVNADVLRGTSADIGPTRDFAEVATHLRTIKHGVPGSAG
jgi:3-hydroxyisobutyrate dehydrogenase/2-hydroxy-3-oxopropionate reductase